MGGSGELRRRLRPASSPGGGAIGDGDDPDRPLALRGIVRHGTDPPGVGTDVLRDARVLVENLLPPIAGVRCPVVTDESHHDGVKGPALASLPAPVVSPPHRTSALMPDRLGIHSDGLDSSCGKGVGERRAPRVVIGDDCARAAVIRLLWGLGGLVEDRPEAGVAAPIGGLCRLGCCEGDRNDRLESVGQRDDVGATADLEQARLCEQGQFGTAREDDLASAPGELLAGQIGADRPEVLRRWHRPEVEPAGVRGGVPGRVVAGGRAPAAGDHPGGRDRGECIDGHARGCRPTDLPGERRHRPFGAAVRPDIGRAPSRTRGDPQDLAVPRLRS